MVSFTIRRRRGTLHGRKPGGPGGVDSGAVFGSGRAFQASAAARTLPSGQYPNPPLFCVLRCKRLVVPIPRGGGEALVQVLGRCGHGPGCVDRTELVRRYKTDLHPPRLCAYTSVHLIQQVLSRVWAKLQSRRKTLLDRCDCGEERTWRPHLGVRIGLFVFSSGSLARRQERPTKKAPACSRARYCHGPLLTHWLRICYRTCQFWFGRFSNDFDFSI